MSAEREYPISYIAGLAWFRDHKKPPPEETLPVCKLLDVKMRELGTIAARVTEVAPDSAFIQIQLDKPIGRKAVFGAFDATGALQPDDKYIILFVSALTPWISWITTTSTAYCISGLSAIVWRLPTSPTAPAITTEDPCLTHLNCF